MLYMEPYFLNRSMVASNLSRSFCEVADRTNLVDFRYLRRISARVASALPWRLRKALTAAWSCALFSRNIQAISPPLLITRSVRGWIFGRILLQKTAVG